MWHNEKIFVFQCQNWVIFQENLLQQQQGFFNRFIKICENPFKFDFNSGESLWKMKNKTIFCIFNQWQILLYNWDNKQQSQAQSDPCKMQIAFQLATWRWEF